MGFFPATKGVRNSHGKRASSVRAIEVLLYSDGKNHWSKLGLNAFNLC